MESRRSKICDRMLYFGIGVCFMAIALLLYSSPDDESFKRFYNSLDLMNRNPTVNDTDIVFTWVNGSHPLMSQLVGNSAKKSSRYRDNNELKYAFRSLDKYLPWYRNIYLLVMHHTMIPSWLDTSHPRVKIVTHHEIFNTGDLPTYNSNAIESNMDKLSMISDKFIYFNDDYFLGRDIQPSDLFTKEGKGRVYFERHVVAAGAKHRSILEKRNKLWFGTVVKSNAMMETLYGLEDRNFLKHAPHVMDKRILGELRQKFSKEFRNNSRSKFRDWNDFCPRHLWSWYSIDNPEIGFEKVEQKESDLYAKLITIADKKHDRNMIDIKAITRAPFKGLRPKFFTLNDNGSRKAEFAEEIENELLNLFPEKSQYEK